jgi:hypothetical protein
MRNRSAPDGTLAIVISAAVLIAAGSLLNERNRPMTSVPKIRSSEAGFPELVEIAERYELPRPPLKAPLVLANTGWTSLVGNSSTSHDPGIYRPAFLLKRLPKGKALVLMGWTERVVSTDSEHQPATRRYTLVQPEAKLKGYLLACNNMSSFVMAVQLAQRGELGEANKLWEKVNDAENFDDDNTRENVGRWRPEPRLFLARCLYQRFYHGVLSTDSNLDGIHRQLVQLQQEFPILFSEKESYYFAPSKVQFVRDLGLTVSAKPAREGSVEALLIDWGNRTNSFRHLGFVDGRNVDSDRPERMIFSMGVKAIPELAKLVDDQRLTRHISPAIMNAPERRIRLGELARRLIEKMTGDQNFSTADATAKQNGAEREFFEKAAVELKKGRISRFHEVPLRILGEKYPESLLALCSQIPAEAAPDTSPFRLAETVADSKLTKEEKTEALAGMCNRLKSISRKRAVLQQLAKVNEERCLALLQPVLAKLPKDVDEPYWTCEAANYTHVVMQLQQDRIWKDYLKVAKRAAVGLRMEMMNPMTYAYIGQKNRQRRLAFLAAFLDDSAVRDPSVDATKYEGPCAAFTFGKITVQDYVAMKIASILRFQERPTEFWTARQWTELRRKVRTALKEENLPAIADSQINE